MRTWESRCRSRIPGPESLRARPVACSSRFSRRNPREWEWASPFAGPSRKPITASYGRHPAFDLAPFFTSSCRRPRRRKRVRRENRTRLVALRRSHPPSFRHCRRLGGRLRPYRLAQGGFLLGDALLEEAAFHRCQRRLHHAQVTLDILAMHPIHQRGLIRHLVASRTPGSASDRICRRLFCLDRSSGGRKPPLWLHVTPPPRRGPAHSYV